LRHASTMSVCQTGAPFLSGPGPARLPTSEGGRACACCIQSCGYRSARPRASLRFCASARGGGGDGGRACGEAAKEGAHGGGLAICRLAGGSSRRARWQRQQQPPLPPAHPPQTHAPRCFTHGALTHLHARRGRGLPPHPRRGTRRTRQHCDRGGRACAADVRHRGSCRQPGGSGGRAGGREGRRIWAGTAQATCAPLRRRRALLVAAQCERTRGRDCAPRGRGRGGGACGRGRGHGRACGACAHAGPQAPHWRASGLQAGGRGNMVGTPASHRPSKCMAAPRPAPASRHPPATSSAAALAAATAPRCWPSVFRRDSSFWASRPNTRSRSTCSRGERGGGGAADSKIWNTVRMLAAPYRKR
jgi:hypothetical protein